MKYFDVSRTIFRERWLAEYLRPTRKYSNSYVVKPMNFSHFESLMDNLGFYWLSGIKTPNIDPFRQAVPH